MISPTEFIAEPDVVLLDLHASSGEDAVRLLHARLAESDGVADAPRFLADLLARMQLGPVCIADEIALPHARTEAVNRIVIAVGRAKEGIFFDTQHPHVRLAFLIGTPKDAATEYLRIVAALSRLLRNGAIRENLMTAADEAEFRMWLAGGLAVRR
jgi:mannitol/fructose-specific phosphotransferase system IIA component (Ntr-type)